MTYADTQEAWSDARRMERYSCIGPDEHDREDAMSRNAFKQIASDLEDDEEYKAIVREEMRMYRQERMIEQAREKAYEVKESEETK